jgi:hypothetical protein
MKKDAYYFSHDSNARNDPKILKLRVKHGMRGYGCFWSIIEMLRDQSNYKLKCDFDSIAFSINESSEIIESIIMDFGLFKVEKSGFFYSTSLMERMKYKEEISKKASQSAKARWDKKRNANAMRTHSEPNANAMQVKESKVNENKLNEINNIIYTANQSFDIFNKNGMSGNYLSKMSEVHSINTETVNKELQKWIISKDDQIFKSEKHLQNSFNNWLRNYKPELKKHIKSKFETIDKSDFNLED